MRIPSGVTDQVIYFVAVDSADFTTRETGLSTFTVYRSRNGAAAAAMTTPTVTEVDATNMPGVYKLLLDEDMTIGSGNDSEEMVFHITQASMAPVSRTIELYRPKITVGNTLDVTATGAAGIDWGNIENKTTANDLSATDIQLVDTVTTYTGNTPQTADHTAAIADIPTVAEFNARTLVAASYFDPAADTVANVTTVATCTTNSDMVAAAPTVAAIADQVWDEMMNQHTTVGSFGSMGGWLQDVLADTNELQSDDVPGLIAALNDPTAATIADAVWDEAKADHTSPPSFGALLADTKIVVDENQSFMETNVDENGIGLTNVGGSGNNWNTTTPPTVAAIADGVWDEDVVAAHNTADTAGALIDDLATPSNFMADVSALATAASIAALNDIAATDIVSNGAITTLAGAVVNVDLVDTVTTNTDMVATAPTVDQIWDETLTAHVTADSVAVALKDILADTADLYVNQSNWLTATGFATSAALATAQADLDTITGTDGVTLATTQALYAPNTVVPDAAGTAAGLHATTDGLITTVDTAVDSILVDTNELQLLWTPGGTLDTLLQAFYDDWLDGGRLDLMLDAAGGGGGDATLANQATILANIATIDAVTSQFRFTIANEVDANAVSGAGAGGIDEATLAKYLGLLMRSDVAAWSDLSAQAALINTDYGSGAGDVEKRDSNEGIRDALAMLTLNGEVGVTETTEYENKEIDQGDDYFYVDASNNFSIEWESTTDDEWPDLTGATIAIGAVDKDSQGTIDLSEWLPAVVTPTGTQLVRLELTATQTAITSGTYRYDLQATLSSGKIRTLRRGDLTVKKTYTDPPGS